MIKFSVDQIKNVKDGMLVIIENKVFDITTFVDLHPGGPNYLKDRRGTDLTKDFMAVHSHVAYMDELHGLQVGYIAE